MEKKNEKRTNQYGDGTEPLHWPPAEHFAIKNGWGGNTSQKLTLTSDYE